MRRTRVVHCALAVAFALVLGACGSEDPATPIRTIEPQHTASSPSPRAQTTRDSAGCQLLTPAERRSIAGQKLEIVSPVGVIKGALVCQWVRTLRSPVTTSLRVTSKPVRLWVKSVPPQIDRVFQEGRYKEKYSKRLQAAKKEILAGTDDLTDKEVCKYFSLLVEVSQGKKGLTEGILFQGTQSGNYKLSWQRCAGGVSTELVYEEPGLQFSIALAQSVIRLGRLAHRRAIKQLV